MLRESFQWSKLPKERINYEKGPVPLYCDGTGPFSWLGGTIPQGRDFTSLERKQYLLHEEFLYRWLSRR
jgi:hypothetical protein